MTHSISFESISELFYNHGYDLLTKKEDYDAMSLYSMIFVFKGPCGHIRKETIQHLTLICPYCFKGRKCWTTENRGETIRTCR